MIAITCHRCGFANLRKNGRTLTGQQKFHCKDCNLYSVLDRKDAERKLREYAAENLLVERLSQRAIARMLNMSRRQVAQIVKKRLTPLHDTIVPLDERPVLERDELWSWVGHKGNQVWVWVAWKRQTRRIVGFAVGDRSEATCRKIWQSLPADGRK